MQFRFNYLTNLFLILFIVLAGCSGQAQEDFGAFPPPEVTLQTLAAKDITVTHEYIGETAPSKQVNIQSRVSGTLLETLFSDGQQVTKGTPLYRLDDALFKADLAAAEANLVSAQATVDQAKRDVDRLLPLAKTNTASQQQLETAQAILATSAASVLQFKALLSRAKLNLSYTQINAPFDGLIDITQKNEGAWINAGGEQILTTLRQLDPLYVYFSIPENDELSRLAEIANGTLIWPEDEKLTVSLKLADGSIWPVTGQVDYRGAYLNKATGSLPIRASVNNPSMALKDGQFVRVLLQGITRPNALVVPQNAVLESPHGKFVYVAEQDDKGQLVAAFRPVELGEWLDLGDQATDKVWVVKSGLMAGEQLILDNLIKVRPGAPVQPAKTSSSSGE